VADIAGSESLECSKNAFNGCKSSRVCQNSLDMALAGPARQAAQKLPDGFAGDRVMPPWENVYQRLQNERTQMKLRMRRYQRGPAPCALDREQMRAGLCLCLVT